MKRFGFNGRWVTCLFLGACVAAYAQNAPATKKRTASSGIPQKELRFGAGKPVLGLPVSDDLPPAHCSPDGTAYFDLNGANADQPMAIGEIYGVSPTGETKHLMRKLPVNFTSVAVEDFYATDHTMVSLLKAVRGEERTRETAYFLSLSDHDGGLGDLVELAVKFKPLKIALFDGGDFLVLGWDEANLLPVLAKVKPDGTVRRFEDLSGRRLSTALPEQVKELQDVVFVANGDRVLATYPRTARGLLLLSDAGEPAAIPLMLPPGYVLHDVLVSSPNSTLVVRAQTEAVASPAGKTVQRVFEVHATRGTIIREFLFAKPKVQELTCAPGTKLSAIYRDTIEGADPVGGQAAMQLVVASVPR